MADKQTTLHFSVYMTWASPDGQDLDLSHVGDHLRRTLLQGLRGVIFDLGESELFEVARGQRLIHWRTGTPCPRCRPDAAANPVLLRIAREEQDEPPMDADPQAEEKIIGPQISP